MREPASDRAADYVRGGLLAAPRLLGLCGYGLPELRDFEVLPLSADLKHPSITVIGASAGPGNTLILMPQSRPFRLRIGLGAKASGNLIVVGRDSQAQIEFDIRANEGTAVIGEQAAWPALLYVRFSSDEETFFWGKRSKCNGLRVTLEGKGRSVVVGEDCMFAPSTEIRTSDLHAVVQIENDEWINPPQDVLLEPHVWLGQGAAVMKGARVGLGAIVGARSVVTKDVPRFSAVGGMPARVLREGVTWCAETQPRAGMKDQLSVAYADLLAKDIGASA